jgi:hypothetical protein
VKVPLVTEAEKRKRRERRGKKPKGQSRRRHISKGSDQRYKEFKILAFYDPLHQRQYAVGTSGDHAVLGRLMRREGAKIRLDEADLAYSVSDGADWIRNQYSRQLPMLNAMVLDYYHLREHLIEAAGKVFGEGTEAAVVWRSAMSGCILEDGPVELLLRIRDLHKTVRSMTKRKALTDLETYVAKRIDMLDYPRFLKQGYEIGSGPTEAFCKSLTNRLKGSGRRWDRPNAEAIMALSSVRQSNLWKSYWNLQRKAG